MAIIGDSIKAISAADYFHNLDAEVTLFSTQKIERPYVVKDNEVIRVHKKFLNLSEQPQERSRLVDLFRVVYLLDPKKLMDEQKATNPDLFEKLKTNLQDSLSQKIEFCIDFDLVIDAQEWQPNFMGAGGPALRELDFFSSENIFYGQQAHKAHVDSYSELAIVGSGEGAAALLVKLEDSLDKLERIFLISSEETPFANIKNTEFCRVLEKLEKQHQNAVEVFLSELKEWDKLEDYMKAKIKRPMEPIAKLVFFAAHNVTAIDKLVDNKRYFLTCEIPEFRKANIQKENAFTPLKTISVDALFILTGHKANLDIYQGLRLEYTKRALIQPEVGFYLLNKDSSEELDKIREDVEKYFSRK